MLSQIQKLTLFYDGECPLCQAEIIFLSERNHAGLLDFIDINSDRYDAATIGISCERALAAMSAQYADGTLIEGVSVFPEAYRRADLPFLAWVFSIKLLQPFFFIGYKVFAKYRHAISKVLGPSALRLVKKRSEKAQQ
jgi:predicted DCC family thiol-disulfide oxidoreductase YuxK